MNKWIRRRRWLLLPVVIGLAALAWGQVSGYLAWRRTLHGSGFVAEMSLPRRGDRVLIVAPHPDDEALGCGGLIQVALQAGAEVHVVLMTNGDASELAVIFGEKELPFGPRAFIELGQARRKESLRALSGLGLPAKQVHFLGFPNNGLPALWQPEHWRYTDLYHSPRTDASFCPYDDAFTPGAPYCGQQVLAELMTLLHEVRPTVVFVTAPQDAHPDHWATCCFVRYALATAAVRGAEWAATTPVYGYLVHWPRFPQPARAATRLALLPPPALSGPGSQWQRLFLAPEIARRKLKAIRSYRSQGPGLARLLLRFARANEAFELLRPVNLEPGGAYVWNHPNTRHRRLGGAQVIRLRLEASHHQTLAVRLDTAPGRINDHAAITLDIRSWDQQGSPLITTIYLRAGGRGHVKHVGAVAASDGPVTVEAHEPRLLEIPALPLAPGTLDRGELLLTCWGSRSDRAAEAAVVGVVRLRPTAAPAP